MSVTEPIYIATAATDAAVRAAAAAANAGGGGRVKLPAGRITLSSALPMYSGVVYEGTPWQPDYRGGQTTGPGGTILVGNGTFNGMEYNASDLGTPPTVYNTFITGMLKGAGALDINFENFLYGLKIGARYNPGIMGGRLERLNFIHCAQWGAWIENYWELEESHLNATNCTVGGIAFVASGATAMNCGNSRHIGTSVTIASTRVARGLVFWSRDSSALNNERIVSAGVQRTTLTELSQAATMTNASANVTVTDGTQFAVDMPVTVSASLNGFVAGQIYFVASVAGNVLTLRNTQGYGSTVSATGNSAVNILSKGFATMEISNRDTSSEVTGSVACGLDLEGSASMLMLLQNSWSHNIGGSFLDNSTSNGQYKTFVSRNSIGSINNGNNTSFDDDATSFNYREVWVAGAFTLQIQSELNFQATTAVLKVAGTDRLNYNSSKTGRWYSASGMWLGTATAANAATGDLATMAGTNYAFASWNASNANGNLAYTLSQGSGNGGAGNTFAVLGVIGTNADGSYGTSTTLSGRNSGDLVLQSYWSGSYKPAFTVPAGTSDFVTRPALSATPPNNGDLVVQATSNTSLTFKYKGSDGTVRTASLTLA